MNFSANFNSMPANGPFYGPPPMQPQLVSAPYQPMPAPQMTTYAPMEQRMPANIVIAQQAPMSYPPAQMVPVHYQTMPTMAPMAPMMNQDMTQLPPQQVSGPYRTMPPPPFVPMNPQPYLHQPPPQMGPFIAPPPYLPVPASYQPMAHQQFAAAMDPAFGPQAAQPQPERAPSPIRSYPPLIAPYPPIRGVDTFNDDSDLDDESVYPSTSPSSSSSSLSVYSELADADTAFLASPSPSPSSSPFSTPSRPPSFVRGGCTYYTSSSSLSSSSSSLSSWTASLSSSTPTSSPSFSSPSTPTSSEYEDIDDVDALGNLMRDAQLSDYAASEDGDDLLHDCPSPRAPSTTSVEDDDSLPPSSPLVSSEYENIDDDAVSVRSYTSRYGTINDDVISVLSYTRDDFTNNHSSPLSFKSDSGSINDEAIFSPRFYDDFEVYPMSPAIVDSESPDVHSFERGGCTYYPSGISSPSSASKSDSDSVVIIDEITAGDKLDPVQQLLKPSSALSALRTLRPEAARDREVTALSEQEANAIYFASLSRPAGEDPFAFSQEEIDDLVSNQLRLLFAPSDPAAMLL